MKYIKSLLCLLALACMWNACTPQEDEDSLIVSAVTVSPESATMAVGESLQLTATISPETAVYSLTWESADETIATVDDEGVVWAIAEGEVEIAAIANGVKGVAKITVKRQVIQATSITLNETELTLKPGESFQLTATVAPEDADDKTVTWTSSSFNTVSVNQGLITATAEGEAVITAQIGELKAECKVTVEAEEPLLGDKILVKAAGKTFTMGYSELLPYYKEGWREHEVGFTKDFYLDRYEVTNEKYAAFLNAEGYKGFYLETGYYALENNTLNTQKIVYLLYNDLVKGLTWNTVTEKWEPVAGFEQHPAIYVTWYGATEYAKWAGGYLPTEAQWEYAYRAGTTTDFFFGEAVQEIDMTLVMYIYPALHDYAVVYSNYDRKTWKGSDPGTEAVGGKLPNPWGFYDMGGNVSEWCSDWYGDYSAESVIDPTGPQTGDYKVFRGGSWFHDGACALSGFRSYDVPTYANATFGFRVAYDVE